MLRIIHSYDIKPGVVEHSFVEWLDSRLDVLEEQRGGALVLSFTLAVSLL